MSNSSETVRRRYIVPSHSVIDHLHDMPPIRQPMRPRGDRHPRSAINRVTGTCSPRRVWERLWSSNALIPIFFDVPASSHIL
jgi:hypothetical protein